jgi:DNA repair protein RadC
MSITDWPINERPRDKLLQKGTEALSDAELIAIFLRTGIVGKNAVDLARELLHRFGSLRALFEASPKQFCKMPGLGLAKYVQLQAVIEMGRRYLHETVMRGNPLRNTTDLNQFLLSKLRNQEQEVFACLFLDSRNRIIQYEELFFGTINTSPVYPREVVKRALYHNATAVILAHNHPSGVAEPSLSDKLTTRQLKKILDLVDIKLLDHIIIGECDIVSLAAQGILF